MFNYDNPIWKVFNKIGDIMILSLVWAFCSIPIFTIGASTTALYYVMMKIVKDEEGNQISDFFKSFKQNFKQATIIWVILLILGIILFLDLKFYGGIDTIPNLILYYFVTFISILFSMILLYIFPLIAKFNNSTKNFFKISLLMALKYFLWTLLMFVIFIAVSFISILIPFISIFASGILAFINSYIFNNIFKKYIPKDDNNKKFEKLNIKEQLEIIKNKDNNKK